MLKRTFEWTLLLGLLFAPVEAVENCQAQASYILVDSINTAASSDSGPWGAGNSHGFEYTPSTSYTFHRIEAMFGSTRAFPVTVAVYDGRNGPLLASGSQAPSQTYTWISFDLSAAVRFTAGETYFIAIQPPTISDSLPGSIVGGDTVLSWWFAGPGTLDFDTAFGSQSPGFRFLADPLVFEDGFENANLDSWSTSFP